MDTAFYNISKFSLLLIRSMKVNRVRN